MILNDLTNSNEQIDFSDAWSEEDLRDLTTFAVSHGENPQESKKEKEFPIKVMLSCLNFPEHNAPSDGLLSFFPQLSIMPNDLP